MEYPTDPELIYEEHGNLADAVIDDGYGGMATSTIIDCSTGEPELVRQGLGEVDL